MEIIAHIRTDFDSKFGIPRQSGMSDKLLGKIVFTKKYRDPNSLRELDKFSYIWVIWDFSDNNKESSVFPLVRPPRLGGNKKVGVFASRSPYRPNPIGLSSLRIEKIVSVSDEGPVIYVSGADMLDNTPIYDIKPYLPYADCHNDARNGFAEEHIDHRLKVLVDEKFQNELPKEKLEALKDVLSMDPRPSYQDSKDRVYSFEFAGKNVSFFVEDKTVKVCSIKNFLKKGNKNEQ